MESHQPRTLILCAKRFPHLPGPDSPCCPQLGDLLKKVVMNIEEERQSRRKLVNIQAPLQCPTDVFQPISQGKSEFLCRRASGFSNVIAANAYRVPLRH